MKIGAVKATLLFRGNILSYIYFCYDGLVETETSWRCGSVNNKT
jgi:hypothetical protein